MASERVQNDPTDEPDPKPERRRKQLSPRWHAFWRGAAVTLGLVTLVLWLWSTWEQLLPSAMGTSLRISAINLAFGLGIGLVIGLLLHFILGRFKAVPARYLGVLAASLVLLITLSPGASRMAWYGVVLIVIVTSTIIGGAVWSMFRTGTRTEAGRFRLPAVIALAAAVVVLAGSMAWLLSPSATPPQALDDADTALALDQPDPSQPGTHAVQTLTYGSGDDTLREEYGQQADLTTDTVDMSAVITGWSDGQGSDRTGMWGFDATRIPVNARVWYPDGDGPFPLVLIVHGNKSTVEFSDPGFAYLGELLASRGMIVASVDENFFNTGILDRSGGIRGTEVARGWLLLEHLKQWQTFASDPESPMSGKVDLERIALVGHSRGGEAVSIAAALNTMDSLPDHPDVALDHGHAIRTVIALAPSDGQYEPAGESITLQDTNYLVLQGSHDADVLSFGGISQYQRTALGPGTIKAALYVGGADHSQFNTLWGNRDIGNGLPKYFLNTGALLTGADQQQVAKSYVSAFLETTLLGVDHRPLFIDYRAGSDFLPETRYISEYAAGSEVVLLDAQDDAKESGAAQGISVTGSQFATWEEEALQMRIGASDNRAVRLAWEGGSPRLDLEIATPAALAPGGVLRLDAAAVSGTSPVELTVEVTDATGQTAAVDVATVPPPLAGDYLRAGWMQPMLAAEPVLQTLVIPAEEITAANPQLDAAQIAGVSIFFDQTATGEIYLDNVAVGAE